MGFKCCQPYFCTWANVLLGDVCACAIHNIRLISLRYYTHKSPVCKHLAIFIKKSLRIVFPSCNALIRNPLIMQERQSPRASVVCGTQTPPAASLEGGFSGGKRAKKKKQAEDLEEMIEFQEFPLQILALLWRSAVGARRTWLRNRTHLLYRYVRPKETRGFSCRMFPWSRRAGSSSSQIQVEDKCQAFCWPLNGGVQSWNDCPWSLECFAAVLKGLI